MSLFWVSKHALYVKVQEYNFERNGLLFVFFYWFLSPFNILKNNN
jgi:hypothetical protein